MKANESNKNAATFERPMDKRQLLLIVDGCKIKLNFPVEPEAAAISDIKRMMFGGVVKT